MGREIKVTTSEHTSPRHGMTKRRTVAEMAAALATSTIAPSARGTERTAANIGGKKGARFFDRMFPNLPPLTASDDALFTLAQAMKDTAAQSPSGDNTKIPAGFTYLGQFVDHDITLDLTPLSGAQEDLEMIDNFRTPGLDLDCIYGSGIESHRFMFRRDDKAKFLIGTAKASVDVGFTSQIPALPNDLERNRHGAALIADHRNDENLLVAQTHLAFLKFHNKVVDLVRKPGMSDEQVFDEASRTVRWHYQWMVLHDFVERLCGKGIVAQILNGKRKFYRFKKLPFMPLEFAGAAYRLGHSMVREEYSHNRAFRPSAPRIAPGSLALLFNFSGLSGNIAGELAPPSPPPPDFSTLPSNWAIDWRRFYDFKTPSNTPNFEFNHSRKLDPFITEQLHTLPGFPPGVREANLAFRNLRRGVKLRLPSGQDVAAFMRTKIAFTPMTEAQITSGPDGQALKTANLHKKTPLWFYILKEAQQLGGGERLGPVGSRLVAEVFIGLVHGDKTSYLWKVGPNWKPTLPSKVPGTFTMTDLLQFVGDISPIDGIATVNTL